MFMTLKKCIHLLNKIDKKSLLIIVFPVIIAQAVLTMLSVAVIMPFLGIMLDPSLIKENATIYWVYNSLGFTSDKSFMLLFGSIVLILLIGSNVANLLSIYCMHQYVKKAKMYISENLLIRYIKKPYEYFIKNNTSSLIRSISFDANVVSDNALASTIRLFASVTSILLIAMLLFIVNPFVTLTLMLVVGLLYLLIFIMMKKKLSTASRNMVEFNTQRMKSLFECFGGIKMIKLMGVEKVFARLFTVPNGKFNHMLMTTTMLAESPRFVLEAIAFGGIISVLLYFIFVDHVISEVISVFALYVFAGYRLMPAFQQIYSSASSIQSNYKVIENIYNELKDEPEVKSVNGNSTYSHEKINLNNEIILQNIKYTYEESNKPFSEKINLLIKANTSVGFVGETGSGKTTIVDILLGILSPQEGDILIDGVKLNRQNVRCWQDLIGYVPQNIYLTDSSIASNIAFGIPDSEIKIEKVIQAAKLANLHNFITQELDSGYETVIGERGIRLSGGQIQRVGIARALYNEPAILIFDEATSSLDGITEQQIIDSLQKNSKEKTIITIAHRLTTIKDCDQIYFLEDGNIVDSGTYEQLMESNEKFRKMAKTKDATSSDECNNSTQGLQ